ncbi:hypothetical protein [Streptomyces sp. NPDC054961]
MTVPSERVSSSPGDDPSGRSDERGTIRRRPLLLGLAGVAAVATGLVCFFPSFAGPISTGATVLALGPVVQARFGGPKERRRDRQ